ncbi:MAG: 50S ribosomal protein L29 [Bacteroidetes bacterium]|jgi:large subunit ribosomal protein L29|nr:50S ribosomal protein L29 [Bacteroidota bacterium]
MKNRELKELPTKELVERYKEEKVRLTKVKFNNAVARIEQPHKLKESRKTVARLLTEINSRRIENEFKAAEKGE